MFERVLVANRGEIAVRVMRTCKRLGVATVAVYSEADAGAYHVREADEAVLIGPPPPTESYLAGERIVEAALATGAEAIHPGYGFLAESARFARQVQHAGLTFIGPGAEAIASMGSKTAARTLMRQAGVPVVPGFQPGEEARAGGELARAAEEIGYPVLVKAAAGGGGKGMRVVHAPADLEEAIGAAQREAHNAFGDPAVYLEKYISEPRHIEFQILADTQGRTLHLFERECSVQRRHQKIIEESPSPFITPELRRAMGDAAVAAARTVGYVNAGTVEFIVDPHGNYYFLEMNTRLQVEHPVTEMVTGLDLVEWQLRVAAGEPLPWAQEDLVQEGHAMECRIYAEDPATGFLPDTGTILLADEPQGVRVDAGVKSGDEVTIHYDPMLSKVIVHAPDRPGALRRMRRALEHYTLLGLTTNRAFLLDLLAHPVFVAGEATTGFVPHFMGQWRHDSTDLPDDALIALALAELLEERRATRLERLHSGDPYNPWMLRDGFRSGEERKRARS